MDYSEIELRLARSWNIPAFEPTMDKVEYFKKLYAIPTEDKETEDGQGREV